MSLGIILAHAVATSALGVCIGMFIYSKTRSVLYMLLGYLAIAILGFFHAQYIGLIGVN